MREQAALQVRQDATRTADNPTGRVFATVYAEDGLVLLPAPSAGDVVFTVATTPVGDDGELAFLWGKHGVNTQAVPSTFQSFLALPGGPRTARNLDGTVPPGTTAISPVL